MNPTLERVFKLRLVARPVAERLLALRHEIAALGLNSGIARTPGLEVFGICRRFLEIFESGLVILLFHRRTAKTVTRLDKWSKESVCTFPYMEAAGSEDLVRVGVASDCVVCVGKTEYARIILVDRIHILLHQRKALRRRKFKSFCELARFVERTEMRLGFK